jgi:preprotein translocase subunit SecD
MCVALAVAIVAAGCSSDGSSSESDATTTTASRGSEGAATTVVAPGSSFSVLAGEGVAVDLDELATNLQDRLVAAGHTEATAEVAGDRVAVTPGDGPLDEASLEGLVSKPGRLEMRQVLAVGATDCEVTVPTGANEESVYPELNDAGDVIACYTVAPSGVTNDAIEDASAVLMPSGIDLTNPSTTSSPQWVASPVLTEAGIDAFNELAAACYEGSAACPTRQIAIVIDGVVLTAPTINEPSFERDLIQISGAFTEGQAKALAAALRSEPLPGGLEVVE